MSEETPELCPHGMRIFRSPQGTLYALCEHCERIDARRARRSRTEDGTTYPLTFDEKMPDIDFLDPTKDGPVTDAIKTAKPAGFSVGPDNMHLTDEGKPCPTCSPGLAAEQEQKEAAVVPKPKPRPFDSKVVTCRVCGKYRWPDGACANCAAPSLETKRPRASWDEYFMNIAVQVATRATCDRKHVGAVIVRNRTILSTGYNGSPRGLPHCDDAGHELKEIGGRQSCVRTVHAEANAVAQAARYGASIEGAQLYTTASPCYDCLKLVLNTGISRIVCLELYTSARSVSKDMKALAAEAGVEMIFLKKETEEP